MSDAPGAGVPGVGLGFAGEPRSPRDAGVRSAAPMLDRPRDLHREGLRIPFVTADTHPKAGRPAGLVRMHDIQAAVDAARMTEAILGMRPPARLVHNTHPTRNV